jgi:hypothetical protein
MGRSMLALSSAAFLVTATALVWGREPAAEGGRPRPQTP